MKSASMAQVSARELMTEHVRRWQQLGPILEEIRDRETRQANTQESIMMMNQAFQIALRDLPARQSSGLVEWQRSMGLWRRRG